MFELPVPFYDREGWNLILLVEFVVLATRYLVMNITHLINEVPFKIQLLNNPLRYSSEDISSRLDHAVKSAVCSITLKRSGAAW